MYCLSKHIHTLFSVSTKAVNCYTQSSFASSITFYFIEAKHGTCKSFVLKTMRNITRLIHQIKSADLASALTCCAGALIAGSTYSRCCSIPC